MTPGAADLLALLSPNPAACAALAHDLRVSRPALRDLASELLQAGYNIMSSGRGTELRLSREDYLRARRELESPAAPPAVPKPGYQPSCGFWNRKRDGESSRNA